MSSELPIGNADLKPWTGMMVRCGIGTDEQKWIAADKLNKRLSSVMNVRNDEKAMRKLIIEIQQEIKGK